MITPAPNATPTVTHINVSIAARRVDNTFGLRCRTRMSNISNTTTSPSVATHAQAGTLTSAKADFSFAKSATKAPA